MIMKSIIKYICSINQLIQNKKEIIPIILLFLLIVPFIILSIYNNPTSDDFCDTFLVKKFGFLNSQIKWYNDYTGRYFSTALLSIYPLFGNWLITYKVLPIIIYSLLFFSIIFTFRNVFNKSIPSIIICLISLVLLNLYIYKIPDICQAFYWVPSALAYQFPNAAMLILFSLITKKTINFLNLLIICFLLIIIIGSNETHMLFADILIGFIFLYQIIKYKKIDWKYFLFFVVTLASSALVVIAPGNSNRADLYKHNLEFMNSLFNSFKYCNLSIINWFPLVLLMILIVMLYKNKILDMFKDSKLIILTKVNPFIIILTTYILTTLTFFPSLYFGGYLQDPGIQFSLLYFLFWLDSFYVFINL